MHSLHSYDDDGKREREKNQIKNRRLISQRFDRSDIKRKQQQNILRSDNMDAIVHVNLNIRLNSTSTNETNDLKLQLEQNYS